MARLRIVKILFVFGAMSFVTRPFIGFALFYKNHHPVEDSILIKVFSKRKPELSEDDSFGLLAFKQKLTNPNLDIFSRFNSFLDVIFPALYQARIKISARFLRETQPPPAGQMWLLCKQLII